MPYRQRIIRRRPPIRRRSVRRPVRTLVYRRRQVRSYGRRPYRATNRRRG